MKHATLIQESWYHSIMSVFLRQLTLTSGRGIKT